MLCVCHVQQCAPAFGAIPSTADLQKKRDEQDEEEDKQTQIMAKICSPDALATLNKLDLSQPEKAEKLRSQLYRMWLQEQLKNGPVGDAYIKKLIAELDGQVRHSYSRARSGARHRSRLMTCIALSYRTRRTPTQGASRWTDDDLVTIRTVMWTWMGSETAAAKALPQTVRYTEHRRQTGKGCTVEITLAHITSHSSVWD